MEFPVVLRCGAFIFVLITSNKEARRHFSEEAITKRGYLSTPTATHICGTSARASPRW
jgi:hypothetical protein